jgi:hypothetical protein
MRPLAFVLLIAFGGFADEAPRLYSEVAAVREGKKIIWHNPGAVEKLDFRYCSGGRSLAPQPPFTFVKEDVTGTNPKVRVQDRTRRQWAVKFGKEASSDNFASCLAWAVGFYTEQTYYVADGVIVGAHDLERAQHWVDKSGKFRGGRFQLRSKDPEFLKDVDWSWTNNPFVGTRELNGLKLIMMLTSNWDDKDIRDAADRGSNTAIYRVGRRYVFFVDDWGGAMGAWGHLATRSKWNAADYSAQTRHFVRIKNGEIEWGYKGQHTSDLTQGIRVSDVRWLLRYLGRITDRQVEIGLRASGATDHEVSLYIPAIRLRVEALQSIGNSTADLKGRPLR